MKILLLLGENDEYLTYKAFRTSDDLDNYVKSIHQLMIANIEKELPLRVRLYLAPEYFPFAGAVQNIEVIDLDEDSNG